MMETQRIPNQTVETRWLRRRRKSVNSETKVRVNPENQLNKFTLSNSRGWLISRKGKWRKPKMWGRISLAPVTTLRIVHSQHQNEKDLNQLA
jgi:hypothetical protein